MKIIKVDAWPVAMRLAESYTIAYQTIETTTNIFLRIETDRGIVGFGCAAPDAAITGETDTTILNIINNIVAPAIISSEPLRLVKILEKLRPELESLPSARAAIDMALYDIMSKVSGLPIWKLLGGFRDHIKTSITIGILPEDETVKKARDLVQRGFRCLKLKGGLDLDSDVARTVKVRQAVGPDIEIRFDANQGYTVQEAIHYVQQTASAGIAFLEQPTPKDQPDLLGRVRSKIRIPIMADESLLTLQDAYRLTKNNLVDLINIKLMRVGGIFEALGICSMAKAANVSAMVGCGDESALAISAGLQLALARPEVLYADLDGHLDLVDDPAAGAVILRNGMLYPNDWPEPG